ncbi:unnamed protein product [Clonostachys rhizophaga]|uniref:Uncharacterized protein n=1 Tax=Clonostachys rhizophaga TaxID=160324 RepID=A0A9N9VDJ9_9HYPO|nr:unnamed protein product [Clonostachys rhizophaga]
MATTKTTPSGSVPTSAQAQNTQYQWESKPQHVLPSALNESVIDSMLGNNVLETGGVIPQEQEHLWAVKPPTSNEFLVPGSPKLNKVDVVHGPRARTPPPLLSHQPVCFNSEEEEYGYYIASGDQLELEDGFLLSQLGDGRDPSVTQQATMRYLPDPYGEDSDERNRLQNGGETSFGGSLEFFCASFLESWDVGIQQTVETIGCDRETSGQAWR